MRLLSALAPVAPRPSAHGARVAGPPSPSDASSKANQSARGTTTETPRLPSANRPPAQAHWSLELSQPGSAWPCKLSRQRQNLGHQPRPLCPARLERRVAEGPRPNLPRAQNTRPRNTCQSQAAIHLVAIALPPSRKTLTALSSKQVSTWDTTIHYSNSGRATPNSSFM